MAKVVEFLGRKPVFPFPPKSFEALAEGYAALRREKLSKLSTERAYYLTGFLAKLEQVLITFTTGVLKQKGFELVSVPDILKPEILEACGMVGVGERNQVYTLDERRHGKFALSGTSEMALAALHANKCISTDLPIRLTAVSRCYRREISNLQEEKGIYRVHEFNKVEMFGLCRPSQSQELLQEFVGIQKEIVNSLELHAQVVDMPPEELGLAANAKFDTEAWMPGQNRYGEISSASNCKDFQSQRLNITHGSASSGSPGEFIHTVNGTACAIPRMLIAILEQHQNVDGGIAIPTVLRKFFDSDEEIALKPEGPFGITWRKSRKVGMTS